MVVGILADKPKPLAMVVEYYVVILRQISKLQFIRPKRATRSEAVGEATRSRWLVSWIHVQTFELNFTTILIPYTKNQKPYTLFYILLDTLLYIILNTMLRVGVLFNVVGVLAPCGWGTFQRGWGT